MWPGVQGREEHDQDEYIEYADGEDLGREAYVIEEGDAQYHALDEEHDEGRRYHEYLLVPGPLV
jgi:hypothetical protein